MKRPVSYALLLCSIIIASIISCSKSDSTPGNNPGTNNCSGEAGPLFSEVKSLMQQKCVSCHNPNKLNGGMNWEVDCNIVANKALIKLKAVDEGTMPPSGPLPQSDKDKITNWINAGGRFSD